MVFQVVGAVTTFVANLALMPLIQIINGWEFPELRADQDGGYASKLFLSQLVITGLVPLIVPRSGGGVGMQDFSTVWYSEEGTSFISNYVVMAFFQWPVLGVVIIYFMQIAEVILAKLFKTPPAPHYLPGPDPKQQKSSDTTRRNSADGDAIYRYFRVHPDTLTPVFSAEMDAECEQILAIRSDLRHLQHILRWSRLPENAEDMNDFKRDVFHQFKMNFPKNEGKFKEMQFKEKFKYEQQIFLEGLLGGLVESFSPPVRAAAREYLKTKYGWNSKTRTFPVSKREAIIYDFRRPIREALKLAEEWAVAVTEGGEPVEAGDPEGQVDSQMDDQLAPLMLTVLRKISSFMDAVLWPQGNPRAPDNLMAVHLRGALQFYHDNHSAAVKTFLSDYVDHGIKSGKREATVKESGKEVDVDVDVDAEKYYNILSHLEDKINMFTPEAMLLELQMFHALLVKSLWPEVKAKESSVTPKQRRRQVLEGLLAGYSFYRHTVHRLLTDETDERHNLDFDAKRGRFESDAAFFGFVEKVEKVVAEYDSKEAVHQKSSDDLQTLLMFLKATKWPVLADQMAENQEERHLADDEAFYEAKVVEHLGGFLCCMWETASAPAPFMKASAGMKAPFQALGSTLGRPWLQGEVTLSDLRDLPWALRRQIQRQQNRVAVLHKVSTQSDPKHTLLTANHSRTHANHSQSDPKHTLLTANHS
jgi:succinate dehydrogenase flavin-adding protein (antitoxin of CptAB toxin-antitoxin module)